ncbi:NAD(P)H-dependent oxidoreductase [Pseudonocardia kujensis]|uniref:NAD(P)H-dependent oxidoreductase n=1 Tax=Pseudonocardia kujensis TaxID=1128675 RepID=UPI001E47CDA9|nr:NAD(P)H-dependent oxidoreductase [Pseudonocardia kujensis]MCE0763303.1 NAD(P)H-dependent oxidoreductase [Pseudonocardia kujensis]
MTTVPDFPGGGGALRVVVVNGSPHRPSTTMGLVDVILDTLAGLQPIDTARVDVYGLGAAFTGALAREDIVAHARGIEEVLRQVENADLLIAAAPVYRGSYPGMFKHFFDLIDQYALANKPVLLAATGGGEHHALVLEHAMRPLFAFFQALTVPVAIFASAGAFDGTVLLDPRVHARIETALNDVVDLLRLRYAPRDISSEAR